MCWGYVCLGLLCLWVKRGENLDPAKIHTLACIGIKTDAFLVQRGQPLGFLDPCLHTKKKETASASDLGLLSAKVVFVPSLYFSKQMMSMPWQKRCSHRAPEKLSMKKKRTEVAPP